MLFIGIDWSAKKHDVCICNHEGEVITSLTIAHTLAEFQRLDQQRQGLDVAPEACCVGIETAHNLLVDFLCDQGYAVYIIPPHATPGYREIERHSRARTDQSDAALLARVVRLDRAHLRRREADGVLIQSLRYQVRLSEQLRRSIQRLQNQLWAALMRAYPHALAMYGTPSSEIACRFLMAFPTPQAAQALSWDDFAAFHREQHYNRLQQTMARYAKLHRVQLQVPEALAEALSPTIRLLANHLLVQIRLRRRATRELADSLAQHPDAAIFTSVPGVGPLLGAGLLVKFGEDRRRYASAAEVQALAGTCPITQSSGDWYTVRFRRQCDNEFRRIAQQLASSSIRQGCAWAKHDYEEGLARGRGKNHALRVVANRWLRILFAMWQRREHYDEACYLRARMARRRPA